MNKLKCKHKKIETWHSGGKMKAQCQDCYKHGLLKSLRES